MSIKPEELKTRESLLALYQSVQNDIGFYRNWEWSITIYYAVLSTGVIGLITNESINKILKTWHLIGLTIIQLAAIYYSIRHLHKAHWHLSWNRHLRNKIENLLGFFEEGIYVKNEPLLPKKFNEIPKYYSIGYTEYVFPFLIFLVLYELVTIYLIWTL